MKVYGLWPIAYDRLLQRTGKSYQFLVATVRASTEQAARQYAVEQDQAGLPWDDPTEFICREVATIGDPLPEGRVLYQWTPTD